MLQRQHIFKAIPVLTAVVLMTTAQPILAGGGHGGGGHGGAAHGAAHAGHGPGGHGYYGHHGYNRGYYGVGIGYGYGWGYYGYGWGGYPWYGPSLGYYPGYYAPGYGPGYNCYPSEYPSGSTPFLLPGPDLGARQTVGDNVAHLEIRAPGSDAEIWLNGVRTKQTGTDQHYKTPAITPGEKYAYDIRARWTENGKPVEVTRTILVQANDHLNVNLAKPVSVANASGEPRDNIAHLQIRTPASDTEVWLNGVRTRQTCPDQRYKTPALKPGEKFSYEIRARWTENGKPVEVTRTVQIKAQDHLNLDLAQPSLAANK